MNKIHKIIRSRKNGSMVAVSELAKGNKKSLTGELLALTVGSMVLSATTAMATTIDITENNQVISDHYDSTSGDPLKINFKDPNYTLIFKDISTTGAIKATDNNITLQVNGEPSKSGGNLIFKNNTNTNNGGAISLEEESILDLSSLNSISFINNISGVNGQGNGGGISSSAASSYSSVTLGRGAYFSSNRAGNNSDTDKNSQGGAIYSTHDVSLNGNSFFVGNLVGVGATSKGGAIYLDGRSNSLGTQNTATFNTDAGIIAFKDNYVNVEKDATKGTSNSIYLNQNTALDLTGNGNIYFDDPIDSGTGGKNSLVKKGAGFVQFDGENYLNTTNSGGKSVDIQEGTFRVVDGASFDASGGGSFNVAEGATLAGGGTIKADKFTISGNNIY